MATRNLYDTQSVSAQLLYSLFYNDAKTAIYAARELYDSELHDLLYKLLTLAWILGDPYDPQQAACYSTFSSQNIPEFLFVLLQRKPINMLPDIGIIPKYPEPGQTGSYLSPSSLWTKWPTEWSELQAGKFYWTIQKCVQTNNPDRAYRLCCQLLGKNILSLISLLRTCNVCNQLIEMLEMSVFAPYSQRILQHAFSCICLPNVYSGGTILSTSEYKKLWKHTIWRPLNVQSDALSAWHVRCKPIEKLQECPVFIAEEDSCPYWQKIVNKLTIRISDDHTELLFDSCENEDAFYSDHFPHDIPDEWTDTEKRKSHGIERLTSNFKNPWQVAFLLCWA
jgi:hypothetical protein